MQHGPNHVLYYGLNGIVQVRAASVFSLSDLAGLTLWFKGDTGTFQDAGCATPASVDSDVMGCWDDQSVTGANVTQATTANKPTLQLAEQNGLPALQGDGSSDTLRNASASLVSAAFTAFGVIKRAGDTATNQIVMHLGPTVGGINFYLDFTTTPQWKVGLSKSNTAVIGTSNTAIPTTSYSLISARYTAAGAWSFRLNRVADGSGTNLQTFAAGANVSLMSRLDGTRYLNGLIGELVWYNVALTDVDVTLVENYLAARWGL